MGRNAESVRREVGGGLWRAGLCCEVGVVASEFAREATGLILPQPLEALPGLSEERVPRYSTQGAGGGTSLMRLE